MIRRQISEFFNLVINLLRLSVLPRLRMFVCWIIKAFVCSYVGYSIPATPCDPIPKKRHDRICRHISPVSSETFPGK